VVAFIALVTVAYVSTNIDDLILLIGFFSHPDYTPTKIVFGQFLGIGCLVTASLLCALAALVIPVAWIGLLGLAPIYLGVARFVTQVDLTRRPPAASGRQILAVMMATIADGGDNIAAYVPIFAGSSRSQSVVVFALFAVMTGMWCWMAQAMVDHPLIGRVFRAWSIRGLPLLLIAIGLCVLWRNGSFGLLLP